jgi:hypothetical protein
MRYSAIIVATGLAAVASAQDLSNFPSCGVSIPRDCLYSVLGNAADGFLNSLTGLTESLSSTGCSLTDLACSVSNQDFINSSTECIQSDCSESDHEGKQSIQNLSTEQGPLKEQSLSSLLTLSARPPVSSSRSRSPLLPKRQPRDVSLQQPITLVEIRHTKSGGIFEELGHMVAG